MMINKYRSKYLNLGNLISKAYCNTTDGQIFCNFGWWGNIPALSLFWRPSVVVEQNYPPVHPVMIPERSLEVHTVRVAIYQKSQEYFALRKLSIVQKLFPSGLPCQSKQNISQSFFDRKNIKRISMFFSLLKANLEKELGKAKVSCSLTFLARLAAWSSGNQTLSEAGVLSRYSPNPEITKRKTLC